MTGKTRDRITHFAFLAIAVAIFGGINFMIENLLGKTFLGFALVFVSEVLFRSFVSRGKIE